MPEMGCAGWAGEGVGREVEAHRVLSADELMTPISTIFRRTAHLATTRIPRRYLSSHAVTPSATLNVPKGSSVFQYGYSPRGRAQPLLALPAQGWTIEQDERWAIVGAGKDRQVLLDVSQRSPLVG